ncbi:N-formylglutamate amidohydrolase [Glycocaulis abyssi]|uniref:N-formylglutamate amidohydrolase n=1 Tax=Glycocaulis abyssi TaxID=1433403 RepID=A0ABV9NBC3_9PROT
MNVSSSRCTPAARPEAVEVLRPAERLSPVVFASPHSGACYSERFLQQAALPLKVLRRSEDAHIDVLFGPVTGLGAPLVRALFPRSYVDPNRAEHELDPVLFGPQAHALCGQTSQRASAGLGVIPRLAGEGNAIYEAMLPLEEAFERLASCYRPYHAALAGELTAAREAFGQSILIDCHSMPAASARGADIVLGDRFGSSCVPDLTGNAERILRSLGFKVVRNRPYAGGFAAEHYGLPAEGRHALQIEISRALYMDERSLEPHQGFDPLKARLEAFAAALVDACRPQSLAAE